MNNSKIKFIAFDFGGVVFTNGLTLMLERIKTERDYNPELIRTIVKSDNCGKLRGGLIEADEFWNWVQTQLPDTYDAQYIRQVWLESYILDQNILDLLKLLKENYKLVAFSGNFKERVEYLQNKYSFFNLFDLAIFSFQCQATGKQDNLMFVELQKQTGDPSAVLLIDNQEETRKVAKNFGYDCVIYQTGEVGKLKNDLINLGIKI